MAFESFSNQIERSRRIESLEKFEKLPRLVLRDCDDPPNSNMATDSPTKCTMGTDPVPDPPDDNYSYFHAAVRVLSDYAAGLEAVTNATNFKQLKKAHQNLIKSIETLEALRNPSL